MKKLISKFLGFFRRKPKQETGYFVYEEVKEDGSIVRTFRDKATGAFYIDAGTLAHLYGFKDQHEFLASDIGLDMIASAAKRSENPLLKLTGNEDFLNKKPTE